MEQQHQRVPKFLALLLLSFAFSNFPLTTSMDVQFEKTSIADPPPSDNLKIFIYDLAEMKQPDLFECSVEQMYGEAERKRVHNLSQWCVTAHFYFRLLMDPRRTLDPREANLFYIPEFTPDQPYWDDKACWPTFMNQLVGIMRTQNPDFEKYPTRHFLTLNRPSRTFRSSCVLMCGNEPTCLYQNFMKNIMILTTEHSSSELPNQPRLIAVPYFSDYHYHKDDMVDAVFLHRARDKFVVGYFNLRHGLPPSNPTYVRNVWLHELSSTTGESKGFVKSSLRTEAMEVIYSNASTHAERSIAYQKSVFCLSPPGDTWSRKATWDSLVYGCIPVFSQIQSFNMPYYCREGEVNDHIGVLVDDKEPLLPQLLQIPPEKVRQMQLNIARLGRSLQYSELTFVQRKYQHGLLEFDAFEVAMSTMSKLAESHAKHTLGVSDNGLYRSVPKP
jgi:hypothetical protein